MRRARRGPAGSGGSADRWARPEPDSSGKRKAGAGAAGDPAGRGTRARSSLLAQGTSPTAAGAPVGQRPLRSPPPPPGPAQPPLPQRGPSQPGCRGANRGRPTSAALRTGDGPAGQQALRRAGTRGARHTSSSARAAAAASRRAPLRSPITQRPDPASRAAAGRRAERRRPGAAPGQRGRGRLQRAREAAPTRTDASLDSHRLTAPRRSSPSSARGRRRGTPPRAGPPRVTAARPAPATDEDNGQSELRAQGGRPVGRAGEGAAARGCGGAGRPLVAQKPTRLLGRGVGEAGAESPPG